MWFAHHPLPFSGVPLAPRSQQAQSHSWEKRAKCAKRAAESTNRAQINFKKVSLRMVSEHNSENHPFF